MLHTANMHHRLPLRTAFLNTSAQSESVNVVRIYIADVDISTDSGTDEFFSDQLPEEQVL